MSKKTKWIIAISAIAVIGIGVALYVKNRQEQKREQVIIKKQE